MFDTCRAESPRMLFAPSMTAIYENRSWSGVWIRPIRYSLISNKTFWISTDEGSFLLSIYKYKMTMKYQLNRTLYCTWQPLDFLNILKGQSYQYKAGVNQWECARSPYSCTAVNHRRSVLWLQWARLSNLEKEVEEWCWGLRHSKIRPRCVIKMVDISGFFGLKIWDKIEMYLCFV